MEQLPASKLEAYGPAKWPTSFKPIEEIAEALGLTVERVLSLADGGFMPHYRIDDGAPMFRLQDVKNWAANNILNQCEGEHLPPRLFLQNVNKKVPMNFTKLPKELNNLEGILDVSHWVGPTCGIYFLVQDSAIAYIGQSVHAASRIVSHSLDKQFNAAFFLPIPRSELDRVEGALIRFFEPPLNGRTSGKSTGKITAPMEVSGGDELTLQQVGLTNE